MLQIGDIEKDWKIGYAKHNRKYQWLACEGCGKERWVFLINVTRKIPVHIYCRKCGIKNGKQQPSQFGEKSKGWKGGRIKRNGYIQIWCNDHPRATRKNPHVSEHILVWEKANNKLLPNGWVVHHLNGIKDDNRIENLVALSRRSHFRVIPEYRRRIRELEGKIWKLENDIKLNPTP